MSTAQQLVVRTCQQVVVSDCEQQNTHQKQLLTLVVREININKWSSVSYHTYFLQSAERSTILIRRKNGVRYTAITAVSFALYFVVIPVSTRVLCCISCSVPSQLTNFITTSIIIRMWSNCTNLYLLAPFTLCDHAWLVACDRHLVGTTSLAHRRTRISQSYMYV